MNHPDILAY